MTKREIANTIVDICANDASFCKDIKVGPERFLSEISEGMGEKEFLFSVDRYLAAFGVRGHLYFYKKDRNDFLGFRVRRYRNSLFVTYSEEGSLLGGDEIIAIDGFSIPQAAEKFKVFLGEAADRQGDAWEKIISYSDKIAVRRAESTFEYAVRTDITRTELCPYESKRIDRDHFYIKLDDFFDEEKMVRFLDGCKEEIENTRYLTIDVRKNCGGSDTVFLPLLKYCLKENDKMCKMPIFSSEDEILCTERNAENRIKLYKSYLENTASEELRRYFAGQIEEQTKNKGKGFVSAKGDGFLFPDGGTRLPERVAVLIDYDCGSSGESFAEIASKLEKVTLIGRPTMGICDYSNLAYFDFGEYVLHYPTSRSKAIDEGRGTRGRGLQPDIYIPWTPKHIREDVDIEAAMEFLAE